MFAFLRKPFRGTGWGLRAPTPAPTLSGKSRQKAAARRLRQKPLNAGLGRGDAQSAYFGRGLGLPLRVGLSGVRPNPRAKPAGVFACASYCRCWERRSGVRNFTLRLRLERLGRSGFLFLLASAVGEAEALRVFISPCGRGWGGWGALGYAVCCFSLRAKPGFAASNRPAGVQGFTPGRFKGVTGSPEGPKGGNRNPPWPLWP